jgi:glycosyltransferase involved in cell wall biosynthesis
MRIAVIPATYNRPDALAAQLEGYLAQDHPDFELVIADDGSGEETLATIRRYRQRAPFRIDHVWQENKGYRAAAIRNRAVAMTCADYIVFTDHDCVPPPDFLSRHASLAERGWFVAGNRVLLTEALTQRVLAARLPIHAWSSAAWLTCRLRGGPFRKTRPDRWQGAKTCNLAVWRDDLVKVNGMDESYAGWGLEDSDLVIRLNRAGVKHKSGRFACPVFHLWHAEQDKSRYPENRLRLEEMLRSPRVVALRGLNQYG